VRSTQHEKDSRLEEIRVSRIEPIHRCTELCDGSGQIALRQLCEPETQTAVHRAVSVTERIRQLATLFGGHPRRKRITCRDSPVTLPGEDLA
jgi:hypothetical protein